jgi:hypothetical protein
VKERCVRTLVFDEFLCTVDDEVVTLTVNLGYVTCVKEPICVDGLLGGVGLIQIPFTS